MPITVQKLASNTADVTIQVGGETVTLTYKPALVTEKVFDEMMKLTGDKVTVSLSEAAMVVNDILVRLIAKWDVMEDEAGTQMFPLDAERLADLPLFFRLKCLMAIAQDASSQGEALAAGMQPNSAASSS
jgi:hypothetical protein